MCFPASPSPKTVIFPPNSNMTVTSPPLYPYLNHFHIPSLHSLQSLSTTTIILVQESQYPLAKILQTPPPITRNFKSPPKKMGLSITTSSTPSHPKTHKLFLFTNYILLGAASSCIFLTLSLRLIPSLAGFFLILLHILTIAAAIAGCAAASSGAGKWYAAHMVATVLTAIFQGSVSVLIFTRPGDFLGSLKSYVREDDGVLILKLAGGLCVLIFCLEWVVLTLAFFLKYYAYLEDDSSNVGTMRSAKVQQDLGYLPYQV